MRRLLPSLAALALLTSCLECEETLITVTWAPEAEAFHIERSFRNVPAASLDCDGPKECVAVLRDVVSGEGWLDDPEDELGDGAVLEGVRLVQRGDKLDVVVAYTAAEGSGAATQAHVFVEQEQRWLRTREHLVVMPLMADGVELLEPKRARTRAVGVSDEAEAEALVIWSLPGRVDEVTLREPGVEGLTPIFSQMPELSGALKAAGLL